MKKGYYDVKGSLVVIFRIKLYHRRISKICLYNKIRDEY